MKGKLIKSILLAATLALMSASAWALGLGQLKLKSKFNEPLLAEIPIVSNDPGELERLQARLASPETFLRVGLPLPDKMVSDLQFAIARDAGGKPFIRVTSAVPVGMPMLTFLLEVDWGDGRLVREYSVLVAEPETVAAASQPEIEAPLVPDSNLVQRDTAEPAPAESMPPPPPATPAPAPRRSAGAVTPKVTGAAAVLRVRSGQTLSGIAAGLRAPGQSLSAVMAALVRDNPGAFIGGNPHRLLAGAKLNTPDAAAVAATADDGTLTELRAQLTQWRRRGSRVAPAVDIASAAPADRPKARTTSRVARRAREARLEIATSTAATSAAAAAGAASGGKGEAKMTQQLQEARETIATRDAEVAELKARVAELENLQKQQAQLIQMKDGELSSAQQALRQRREAEPAATGGTPWFLLAVVLALVALAGLFWGWWRRRRGQTRSESDALPSFARAQHVSPDAPATEAAPLEDEETPPPPFGQPDATEPSSSREPSAQESSPSWTGRPAAVTPLTSVAGTWSPPQVSANDAATSASDVGDERLALAETYLELDDQATARMLLQQVIDEGALTDAARARQLLDRLD
ncbi:hypothetical protein EBB59_00300 [Lysobacter pythonis]|uniref:FimV N-terminal domain-containing protein n=1 Tax=Solilutibacter pythonis TaxID=2483112 RepID=A0A3M2I0U0_9GAMM|nr:FimV/HubP family polar landmark protein [Lysobacter pythonis]RMH94778.1 hypothetical protein EBB59_00300 [Lysobacter pythonis]